VSYYKNTYQHGGISLEEMIIPALVFKIVSSIKALFLVIKTLMLPNDQARMEFIYELEDIASVAEIVVAQNPKK
jgi:hypothetical protein